MKYLLTVYGLARALLTRYMRDKTALFFTFIFPLIFLFVFGSLFNGNNDPSFSIALSNNSTTEFSAQFVEQLSEGDTFEVNQDDDFTTAEEKLGRGEYDAIVELPVDFGQPDEQGRPSGQIMLYYDESDQQLAQTLTGVMQGVIDGVNEQFVQTDDPISLRTETLQTSNLTQFDYTFSGLLGFAVLSIGIFALANTFPAEKKAGYLRRLRATPLRSSQLILATTVQYLIVGLMSVATMMIVGMWVFDFNMRGDYFNFTVFTTLGILLLFGFGLAIGGWARNENQAAPLSNLIAFPMMFLSGVFFPVFLMPQWLQSIAVFIPLTPVVEGMRLILTEGATLLGLGSQLGVMAVWTVVIYSIAIRTFRWE